MTRKPASVKSLLARKGEAATENRYIGDDAPPAAKPEAKPPVKQIDGRTLRRTGRTHKFAATVKPEWSNDLKTIAASEGRLIVEILEDALEAYKEKGKR